eukprot:TRINITY_DN3585_c1_g2_i1.p1 TRINITY_DN3585_c1_g2~~TRINITY_DN3585_c1_g2_i1.p1  ORF type:complete len:227 (+),score=37.71 TRINITY_DN3585_c1_g2_i1:44-682(+)
MSITVFVKTISEDHEMEVSGKETVGKLYTKAACATSMQVTRFNLIWEGKILDRNGDETVQGSGFMEGSVICLEERNETVTLWELRHIPERVAELHRLLSADPDIALNIDAGLMNSETTLALKTSDLPCGLRRLIVTDTTGCITTIGDDFLFGCDFLTSISIVIPNLTTVGTCFLFSCDNLRTVDLEHTSLPPQKIQELLPLISNWRITLGRS